MAYGSMAPSHFLNNTESLLNRAEGTNFKPEIRIKSLQKSDLIKSFQAMQLFKIALEKRLQNVDSFVQGPLLLICISFNPSMDKLSYAQ